MNINALSQIYASGGAPGVTENRKSTEKSGSATQKPTEGTEKVELSSTSMQVQTLTDMIKQMPETRADLVEKMRRRISGERYPLEELATKLVDSLIENRIV